ncbi:MAG: phosphocholine cytidylyltransferase family protein [Candidatus Rokubacteria bacterium]|nr:phosphocholine cytidylyltransferase family protein [Candidatus Rokubacteria bacterium]
MNAIVLAAGVGRRLAPLTDTTHKCLLPVGGRPLLARMLESLASVGVEDTALIVGHCADQVQALAGDRFHGMPVRYVHNPDYARGSVLSLRAARDLLGGPTLVMDADVLFAREILARLVRSAEPTALLIDRGFADTGEEEKAYVVGERVVTLSKKVVPERWDTVGESVGFFKFGPSDAPELVRMLDEVVAEGTGLEEYEDAIHRLSRRRRLGWVDVTGLPWTEIDFVEDLRRAETDVLPRL